MGLKFIVSEAQTRSSQASQVSSQAQQAAVSLQQSIQSFLSAPLSSKAYDSAKNYFMVAYTPICQSIIMTGEALASAHKKFLSEYQATVGGLDTDEDKIQAEIDGYQDLIHSLDDLIRMAKTPRPDLERRSMNAYEAMQKRQEKLEKLRTYSAQSASFFSEYESSQQELNNGLAQVKNCTAWNASSGTFNIKKLDMNWAKPINSRWKDREKMKTKVTAKAQGNFIEDTVFPINQDVAMGLGEEWLNQSGPKVATTMFNAGTKYFGGTEIASGFYAGSKIIGSAGKAMPFIGAAIDYGSQVASGENAHDALAKTGAHAIAGVGIGLAVGAISGLPILGAVALTVGAGLIVNTAIDYAYDKLKKPVGNAVKSVGKWLGSLWK
ncbi:T7SS effector LXG polymorphic toxin [Enterococcus sp. AZ192]|uniref:T7SS effector LXG polymorphic toxin n=1 Tax=unclassified Enterococcus TaxID=2608891 RepID=UPI003D2E1BF9